MAPPLFAAICTHLGYAVLAYLGWTLIRFICGVGWACVTGCTDGIGKSLVTELAKNGFNVVLISRTQSKLDELKTELASAYPAVRSVTVAVDYTNFDAKAQDRVKTVLSNLEDGGLAILINNVGIAYDFPKFFDELTVSELNDMIRINCDSTTLMSHLALPLLLARKGGKRKGAIINIASAAGLSSMPLLSQYSAAKAYVRLLTEGLAYEYAAKGIDVQVQAPYYVVSKLSKFRHASLGVPSSKAYAQLVLDNIGYETVSNPHFVHAIMGFFVCNVLPLISLADKIVMDMHLGIRAKAMKKAAEKGKVN